MTQHTELIESQMLEVMRHVALCLWQQGRELIYNDLKCLHLNMKAAVCLVHVKCSGRLIRLKP